MFRASAIAFRRILRRPATWLLIWSGRHVIGLWGRSIFTEVRRTGGTNSTRFKALVRGLWSETVAAGFTSKPATRVVTVLDDGTPGSPTTVGDRVYEIHEEVRLDPQPA